MAMIGEGKHEAEKESAEQRMLVDVVETPGRRAMRGWAILATVFRGQQ
jgi:hypothetical protein